MENQTGQEEKWYWREWPWSLTTMFTWLFALWIIATVIENLDYLIDNFDLVTFIILAVIGLLALTTIAVILLILRKFFLWLLD